MGYKVKRTGMTCLCLCLVVSGIFAITYYNQKHQEEQYYRSFYRADLEIDKAYFTAFQTIYDEVVRCDYDKEHIVSFTESDAYKSAIAEMQAQVDERKVLYGKYPVVDSSELERARERVDQIKTFISWVQSPEFDEQYAEGYFFLLGLDQDPANELEFFKAVLSDPEFPSKSDNYVNSALGHTPLVAQIR